MLQIMADNTPSPMPRSSARWPMKTAQLSIKKKRERLQPNVVIVIKLYMTPTALLKNYLSHTKTTHNKQYVYVFLPN